MWEEVGDMVFLPSNSTVLRMRDGYRELYKLYFEYLFAKSAFGELSKAIKLRNVDKLYEFWCALKIMEILWNNELIEKVPLIESTNKIPEGLIIKAKLRNGREFRYQMQTTEGEGGRGLRKSYTGIDLRPDFVIYAKEERRPILILDAKFAFDEDRKRPKPEDIVKMHAYRDALKSPACVILYPGEGSEFCFSTGEKNDKLTIKSFLKDTIEAEFKYMGIGWFKMLPAGGERDEKCE